MCYSICRNGEREPVFIDPLSLKFSKCVASALLVSTIVLGLVAIIQAGEPGKALREIGTLGGIAMITIPLCGIIHHLRQKVRRIADLKVDYALDFPLAAYKYKSVNTERYFILLIHHPEGHEPQEEFLVFTELDARQAHIANLGQRYGELEV